MNTIIDNDLLSIQEARILAENAREAQKLLAAFSQEKLDEYKAATLRAQEAAAAEKARSRGGRFAPLKSGAGKGGRPHPGRNGGGKPRNR